MEDGIPEVDGLVFSVGRRSPSVFITVFVSPDGLITVSFDSRDKQLEFRRDHYNDDYDWQEIQIHRAS